MDINKPYQNSKNGEKKDEPEKEYDKKRGKDKDQKRSQNFKIFGLRGSLL